MCKYEYEYVIIYGSGQLDIRKGLFLWIQRCKEEMHISNGLQSYCIQTLLIQQHMQNALRNHVYITNINVENGKSYQNILGYEMSIILEQQFEHMSQFLSDKLRLHWLHIKS